VEKGLGANRNRRGLGVRPLARLDGLADSLHAVAKLLGLRATLPAVKVKPTGRDIKAKSTTQRSAPRQPSENGHEKGLKFTQALNRPTPSQHRVLEGTKGSLLVVGHVQIRKERVNGIFQDAGLVWLRLKCCEKLRH
jgi:hypothetical protein